MKNSESKKQLNNKASVRKLRQQVDLMRTLASPSGFIKLYFKELRAKENGKPKYGNTEECFNHINQKHFDLFKVNKYCNYNSFKIAYESYLKPFSEPLAIS
ncbi:MAG: hypothetical protein NWP64_05035 [Maribacter sp.]|nr:hypothetical protein [Maribacter sp.]